MVLEVYLSGGNVRRATLAEVVVYGVLVGSIVSEQNKLGCTNGSSVSVYLTVCCRTAGYVIPCGEGVACLGRYGKSKHIANCEILGCYRATTAGVIGNGICVYLNGCPSRGGAVYAVTNLDNVYSALGELNSCARSDSRNGIDLAVVYLELIIGSSVNGRPGYKSIGILKIIAHRANSNVYNIACKRLGSADSANSYSIAACCLTVKSACYINSALGGLKLLVANRYLILCCSVYSVPAENGLIKGDVLGSCDSGLVDLDLTCLGRIVACGLGEYLYYDTALKRITALDANGGLASVIIIQVIVICISAVYGYYILRRAGNGVPMNGLGCLVIAESLNSGEASLEYEGLGNGGCVSVCNSLNDKLDTALGHLTVGEAEGSGGTVIDLGMLMLCVTADNGYKILLSICYRVVNQHVTVDHLEAVYLTKHSVGVVSYSLGVVSLTGVCICNYLNGVLANKVEGIVHGISTNALCLNKAVRCSNGYVVGSCAVDGAPADSSCGDVNYRSGKLSSKILGLPKSIESLVGAQSHSLFIAVRKLATVVGHAYPPAVEGVALTLCVRKSEELTANGLSCLKSSCVLIVKVEINVKLYLVSSLLGPTRIYGGICGYGLRAELKGSLEICVSIPADKQVAVADGVCGLSNGLTVEDRLCLNTASAVRLEACNEGDLLKEVIVSSVKGQVNNAISKSCVNGFHSRCVKGESESSVLQRIGSGIGVLNVQNKGIVVVQRQGIFIDTGVKIVGCDLVCGFGGLCFNRCILFSKKHYHSDYESNCQNDSRCNYGYLFLLIVHFFSLLKQFYN